MTTTRHEWAHGWFEIATGAPHASLQPLIRGEYCGWTECTSRPVRRLETATTLIPIIINFGPAYTLISGHDRVGVGQVRRSFVAGLYDTWVAVESGTTSYAMQVNLTPLGARRVFGVDMHELTARSIELVDVFGPASHALVEALGNASDWSSRFSVFDAFLRDRVARSDNARRRVVPDVVSWAWREMERQHGDVRIGDLTTATGWSAKRLIAAFRAHVGLPPKTIARVLRFEHTIARLASSTDSTWAARALESGYYDQSHCIRDFAQYAGCTPTEYLQSRLPAGGGVVSIS